MKLPNLCTLPSLLVVSTTLVLTRPCTGFAPVKSPTPDVGALGRPLSPLGPTLKLPSTTILLQSTCALIDATQPLPFYASYANNDDGDGEGGSFSPIFDFSSDEVAKKRAVDGFERIDDVIMGGISLSALRDVPGKPYASWSGVCRTDGGGFCGMRTMPFVEPLDAEGADGVYVDARLASDDEPERRVWKVTLRTDSSRGEMVYQAAFLLPKRGNDEGVGDLDRGDWTRVKVPFDDFKLVRGPRVVPDGPPLDATGGIFQIGMSLSKFIIGTNTTQLENFRAGYFDLQLKEIGFYSSAGKSGSSHKEPPLTLSKEEMQRKRPLLLNILTPVAKLLFSEKANRRKSTMKILTEQRRMSRPKAIIFGITSKSRAGSFGVTRSIVQMIRIIAADSLRTSFRTLLRISFFYPVKLVGKLVKLTKKLIGMRVKELPPMA